MYRLPAMPNNNRATMSETLPVINTDKDVIRPHLTIIRAIQLRVPNSSKKMLLGISNIQYPVKNIPTYRINKSLIYNIQKN